MPPSTHQGRYKLVQDDENGDCTELTANSPDISPSRKNNNPATPKSLVKIGMVFALMGASFLVGYFGARSKSYEQRLNTFIPTSKQFIPIRKRWNKR